MLGLVSRAEAVPKQAPSSCIPASSLASNADGKGQDSALRTCIKKPSWEMFSSTFLQTRKKKIKNHHSDTIKTSTNLSGNSGAERDYPGTPLDPLSSHQTDHSWELNLAAMKDLPLSWPISWNLSWEFKEGNLLMQRLQCCTGTSAHQAFKGSVWGCRNHPRASQRMKPLREWP